MKYLLAFLLFASASCEKDDAPNCKTCDDNVHMQRQGQPNLDYVESSVTYCNGEWEGKDGKVIHYSGTQMGQPWHKTVTTECR